ncbi:MAG TPA: hypothetical protein VIL34_09995 [Actinopolymorphaceae bacterium]
MVTARFEGWVPSDCLVRRQERAFFHFRTVGPTPDRWFQRENDQLDFHLYWVALTPKPDVLLSGQQEWLDEFYDDLLAGVGARRRRAQIGVGAEEASCDSPRTTTICW